MTLYEQSYVDKLWAERDQARAALAAAQQRVEVAERQVVALRRQLLEWKCPVCGGNGLSRANLPQACGSCEGTGLHRRARAVLAATAPPEPAAQEGGTSLAPVDPIPPS